MHLWVDFLWHYWKWRENFRARPCNHSNSPRLLSACTQRRRRETAARRAADSCLTLSVSSFRALTSYKLVFWLTVKNIFLYNYWHYIIIVPIIHILAKNIGNLIMSSIFCNLNLFLFVSLLNNAIPCNLWIPKPVWGHCWIRKRSIYFNFIQI